MIINKLKTSLQESWWYKGMEGFKKHAGKQGLLTDWEGKNEID